MKKSILGLVVIGALIAGPAVAADLRMPVKAPPPIAPVSSWTGWYVGLNAGGVWSSSEDTVAPSGCFLTSVACGGGPAFNPIRTANGNLSGSGFTGGGQIGYNWQNSTFVYGLEADFNGSGLNAIDTGRLTLTAPLAGSLNHTVNGQLDWFGTVRGRLGVTPVPQALLYVTGGLAYGQIKSNSSVSFTTTADAYAGSLSTNRTGWTVGGGAEWAFAPKWSAKLEYLYVDLGNESYVDACVTAVCAAFAPPPAFQTNLTIRENIVRFGVNYRFGGGALATRD